MTSAQVRVKKKMILFSDVTKKPLAVYRPNVAVKIVMMMSKEKMRKSACAVCAANSRQIITNKLQLNHKLSNY